MHSRGPEEYRFHLPKMDKVAFVADFLATGVAKEGIPFALFVRDFDDFEVIRRIEPKWSIDEPLRR